jgi:hypothetical protein
MSALTTDRTRLCGCEDEDEAVVAQCAYCKEPACIDCAGLWVQTDKPGLPVCPDCEGAHAAAEAATAVGGAEETRERRGSPCSEPGSRSRSFQATAAREQEEPPQPPMDDLMQTVLEENPTDSSLMHKQWLVRVLDAACTEAQSALDKAEAGAGSDSDDSSSGGAAATMRSLTGRLATAERHLRDQMDAHGMSRAHGRCGNRQGMLTVCCDCDTVRWNCQVCAACDDRPWPPVALRADAGYRCSGCTDWRRERASAAMCAQQLSSTPAAAPAPRWVKETDDFGVINELIRAPQPSTGWGSAKRAPVRAGSSSSSSSSAIGGRRGRTSGGNSLDEEDSSWAAGSQSAAGGTESSECGYSDSYSMSATTRKRKRKRRALRDMEEAGSEIDEAQDGINRLLAVRYVNAELGLGSSSGDEQAAGGDSSSAAASASPPPRKQPRRAVR